MSNIKEDKAEKYVCNKCGIEVNHLTKCTKQGKEFGLYLCTNCLNNKPIAKLQPKEEYHTTWLEIFALTLIFGAIYGLFVAPFWLAFFVGVFQIWVASLIFKRKPEAIATAKGFLVFYLVGTIIEYSLYQGENFYAQSSFFAFNTFPRIFIGVFWLVFLFKSKQVKRINEYNKLIKNNDPQSK